MDKIRKKVKISFKFKDILYKILIEVVSTFPILFFFKGCIVVYLVLLPSTYFYLFGEPAIRGFICNDPAFSRPYKGEHFNEAIFVCPFTFTVILVLVTEYFYAKLTVKQMSLNSKSLDPELTAKINKKKFKTIYLKRINEIISAYIIGNLFLNSALTSIKYLSGALRPYFFDVCQPIYEESCEKPTFINNYRCSLSSPKIKESRLSYFSAHACFSMYLAVWLCWYINLRLTKKSWLLVKALLFSITIWIPLIVSITRVTSNHHHIKDVVSGAFFGMITGLGIIYLFYLRKEVISLIKYRAERESDVESEDDDLDDIVIPVEEDDDTSSPKSKAQRMPPNAFSYDGNESEIWEEKTISKSSSGNLTVNKTLKKSTPSHNNFSITLKKKILPRTEV